MLAGGVLELDGDLTLFDGQNLLAAGGAVTGSGIDTLSLEGAGNRIDGGLAVDGLGIVNVGELTWAGGGISLVNPQLRCQGAAHVGNGRKGRDDQ